MKTTRRGPSLEDVKTLVPFLVSASLALAQQSQTSNLTFDVNGHPVEGATSMVSRSPGSADRIETVRSINGRNVPVESVEDKVISDSGGVKVVERLVKRYDAGGRSGAPEKVRIEERKNPDGSVNTSTSVLRADINGTYAVAERSVTESRKSGDTTVSSTVIERPTLNGSMQAVERKEDTRRESADGSVSENSTILRRDTNGRFAETARQVVEKTVSNGKIVENTATYEATSGQMELVQQTVSKEVTGSNQREVDVFEAGLLGRAGDNTPQLREQRLIEKKPTATGAVESISIRRPSPSDPGKLGIPQKVGEVVCTGKCK